MAQHILILGCKNYPAFSSNQVISSGMEVYVTELVKYLKAHFRITLITADSETSHDDRVTLVNVPIFGGRLFQPVTLLFFSFFPAFRRRKKIALINAQTPLSGLIAFILKKLFRIPYIVSVHMYATSSDHTGHYLLSTLYFYVEKLVYSAADKIVCAGYRLKEHIHDQHHVAPDRMVVIHPGAGPIDSHPQTVADSSHHRFVYTDDCFRVLFLGRLIHENGIMDLLDAIKLIADQPVKLLIAGNGNLEATIRRAIEKEGLHDKIELLGIVTGDDKTALLENVDLVIRTSYHEVFPVAYLEALAHGVPVVATPVGDTEYMAQQTGGIDIVPIKDPGKIAAALLQQMQNDGLKPEVVSRCQTYLQSISWSAQANLTISLFNEIIGNNKKLGELP